jgi:tryptophan synthase alpha chain
LTPLVQTAGRIERRFTRARQENRAALIAYLTAGDPSPEFTPHLVAALERGGSERALSAGTTLRDVLNIARRIRERSDVPMVLFTYLNPVVRYGFDALAREAKSSGIDGCLFTDLSVEEAESYVTIMRSHRLDSIFLAAPTSTERRLRLVAKYSTGFVYLVSRTGVTGEQVAVSDSVVPLVRAMRAVTDLPLAVGFGISSSAQVAQVAAVADGVAVGSAFVRTIATIPAEPVAASSILEQQARDLAAGLVRKP